MEEKILLAIEHVVLFIKVACVVGVLVCLFGINRLRRKK